MTVRTNLRIPEHRDQSLFDTRRNRMFEAARFGADLVPPESENLGEEALGEAMAAHHADGDLEALDRQFDVAARPMLDKSFAAQLLEHTGDGRGANAQAGSERGCRRTRTLAFQPVNRLEILFGRLVKVGMAAHISPFAPPRRTSAPER